MLSRWSKSAQRELRRVRTFNNQHFSRGKPLSSAAKYPRHKDHLRNLKTAFKFNTTLCLKDIVGLSFIAEEASHIGKNHYWSFLHQLIFDAQKRLDMISMPNAERKRRVINIDILGICFSQCSSLPKSLSHNYDYEKHHSKISANK